MFNWGVKALKLGKVKVRKGSAAALWQSHWEAGDPGIRLRGSSCDRNLFRTETLLSRWFAASVCVLSLSLGEHVRLWWLPHGAQPAWASKGSSVLWPKCLHMDEKEESVSIALGGLCAMKLKHQKVGFHVFVQKVCAQFINRLKLDILFHLGHLILGVL